jgi:Predicted transcriptional regulator, contains C-terminal CBS domains
MMKVSEVMTKDVITCSPEEHLTGIVKLMSEKDVSGIPVLDGDRLAGIVTEGDIMKILASPLEPSTLWLPSPFEVLLEVPLRDIIELRNLQKSIHDIGQTPVKDVMTKDVITIAPENDVEDAAAVMVRYNINRLPVVKNKKLVGIIARNDIIKGLGGRK